MVPNPSVAVNLRTHSASYLVSKWNIGTHVGKKLMKLSPNSWEQHMTAKIGTFGSWSAILRPANGLEKFNIWSRVDVNQTYDSFTSSSASPASSASRTWARRLSAGESQRVLCGYHIIRHSCKYQTVWTDVIWQQKAGKEVSEMNVWTKQVSKWCQAYIAMNPMVIVMQPWNYDKSSRHNRGESAICTSI